MTGIEPQEGFRPLREYGITVMVLLGLIVAMITAQLVIWLIGQFVIGWPGGHLLSRLDQVCDVTMLVTGILFAVWFRRARINAERSGWRQRRARAWTFWGWVLPIVSLWIPFQLMGDIWRADLPPEQRHGRAGPPVLWWTTWLLSGASVGARRPDMQLPGAPFLAPGSWPPSLCLLAISGITLFVILGKISIGPVGSPAP